ncbi:hypothetical protein J3R82DRAFT_2592 [Butyriboletus roseoflavus]|nr:hypothetical protein J3R82DRAFT_2592 [Butyriboletus roseoflavus]
MSTLKVQLDRIDLSTNSRDTSAALIKLLAPHVPYSLHILGTILNTSPRGSTLQNVDASKVTLWSTMPLHSDAISTTIPPVLFSVVTFSHLDHHFRFFCSGESRTSDPPTEAEETHVKQVFERLRDIAGEARPTCDSILTVLSGSGWPRRRIDTDPPMIVIWAVHAKWAHVLAPMSTFQHPSQRYVFPRGAFARDGVPLEVNRRTTLRGPGGDDSEADVQVSQIQASDSDLSFVHGASSVPRSEAYILSRAPYSVCLRSRGETGTDGLARQPVACALMHSDGSIGALRVDPKHQRRGLGRLVVRALTEKLDFSKGQGDLELASDGYGDLGGGALGWNWTDTEAHNEAGNRFFTSLGGKENGWTGHWTYMLVNPDR